MRFVVCLALMGVLVGCGTDAGTTAVTDDPSAASSGSITAVTGSPPSAGSEAEGTTDVDVDLTTTSTTTLTTTTTAGTTTTAAPTTPVPEPEVTPAGLAATGPYPVGVTTRTLPAGNLVELWYPADESGRGATVQYSVRDFLPPAIAALVPDTIDDTRSIDAARDAVPAQIGPFPVVLFSHGSTSFRLQSSVLAHHLASWGIATASADHASRDLLNVLGGTAPGQSPAVDDLRALRTYVGTLAVEDPLLGGMLDTNRIALGGHSAGGGTVAEMADDEEILGYVSFASGLGDATPDVPSLFMAAENDMIIDPVTRTEAAFDRAPAPSWLWVFDESGHLAFSDLCAVGSEGATLIDLAEAAGLGALIDDGLRTLATDGCEAPNRPVEEIWPGVHQAATGFYRWVFGTDSAPVGLDQSAVTEGVAITAK